jgi:hypothetical protein
MSRLTDEQILELALDLESPRVERKAALNSPAAKAKAQRAICAFGNDLLGVPAPGPLIVGAAGLHSPSIRRCG